MNYRNYVIGGAAILLILLAFGLGMVAQKTLHPCNCPEEIGRVVSIDTVKPVVPDGRTIAKAGKVRVKPIPAKINKKPATGLSDGTGVSGSPDTPIQPQEVTIDSAGVVEIPITLKEYKTELYRAVVKGYQPELTEIELYQRKETVTVRKPPRWALTVGPSAGYTPEGFQPGVNVTLGFVIWSK